MPTRLLDWTTDPLIGLYFAVAEDPDRNTALDGAVFVLDAYEMVSRQNGRDGFGVGSLQHQEVTDALGNIAWEEGKSFPKFSFPLQAAKRDVRIRNQSSCFTFHTPEMAVLDEPKLAIHRIVIPFGKKEDIRKS